MDHPHFRKPFRAVPLRVAVNRPRSRRRPWWPQISPIMVMLPLAAFTAVFVYGLPALPELAAPGTNAPISELADLSEEELRRQVWPTTAEELDGAQPRVEGARLAAPDTESARFAICGGGARVNCVVDGDTFWYGGEKFRIADVNTPEVSRPACAREAELGAAATERLHELLNEGAFTLGPASSGDDRDRYDRLLRTVTREGESLGGVLVREGLAEEWRGYRGSWC